MEAVPGTPFGVAYPLLPPTMAGLAVGSLVTGIGAILVALVVVCAGALAAGGPGPVAVGAFAVLAVLAGAGAGVTGIIAVRQSRRRPGELSGRGLAIAGIACGGSAVLLTVVGFVLAVTLG